MSRGNRTLLLVGITLTLPVVVHTLGSYPPSEMARFLAYTVVLPVVPFAALSLLSWRRSRDGQPRHSTRRIGTVASVVLATILLPYLVGHMSALAGGTTPVLFGCLLFITPFGVPLVAVLAWGLTEDMDAPQPSAV